MHRLLELLEQLVLPQQRSVRHLFHTGQCLRQEHFEHVPAPRAHDPLPPLSHEVRQQHRHKVLGELDGELKGARAVEHELLVRVRAKQVVELLQVALPPPPHRRDLPVDLLRRLVGPRQAQELHLAAPLALHGDDRPLQLVVRGGDRPQDVLVPRVQRAAEEDVALERVLQPDEHARVVGPQAVADGVQAYEALGPVLDHEGLPLLVHPAVLLRLHAHGSLLGLALEARPVPRRPRQLLAVHVVVAGVRPLELPQGDDVLLRLLRGGPRLAPVLVRLLHLPRGV
mmetsp:Transcript_5460/g.18988  ORF Transcript_5460/g.18988 Transcript_5460/m.18988 type:complete len:284 (+) Transcript_5460:517-1368(+)